MPAGLTEEETAIFNLILGRGGKLRANKPKVDKANPLTGKAAYVWRMVAFMVSTNYQHHCTPMTADFDLPAFDENGKWNCKASRDMVNELEPLVKKITNAVPLQHSHGAMRRGRALGMI